MARITKSNTYSSLQISYSHNTAHLKHQQNTMEQFREKKIRRREKREMDVGREEKDKPNRRWKGCSTVLWHRQSFLSGALLQRWMQSAHGRWPRLTQSLE